MLLPDAEADMWEADKEGVRLLPTDPDAAVEAVAGGLDLGDALADEASLIEAFRPVLSRSDRRCSRTRYTPGPFSTSPGRH